MAGPNELIAALQDPAAYLHPAERVALVETHISWVLLAGEFAYKIKKPLTLPFLDYATLDQRRAGCDAELALNRRWAPGLYLDVVGIGGPADEPPRLGGTPVREWAVAMRRFDTRQVGDALCRAGALTAADLRDLAKRLAAWQADAPVAPADSPFGAPASIIDPARDNFITLRDLRPGDRRIDALAAWTDNAFAGQAARFAARRDAGRVREGHGDLHLGNLVRLDDALTPFDGIEFCDAFRWIDVASDIAFLWMDLRDRNRPDLAAAFLDAWLTASGDFDALGVLRFYAVYRAVVRAKIAALRADQKPNTTTQADEAGAYLDLAGRIAGGGNETPAAPPALAITCGLSGSGKTTQSTAWLETDPDARRIRIRSDVERKRLFGLEPLAHSRSAVGDGIYTPEANTRTYDRLAALARAALADGWSVVVDAAFLRRAERHAFATLARECGASFGILYCTADDTELARRVANRQGDPSEATVAVVARQRQWFEPLDADEHARCIVLDTGVTPDAPTPSAVSPRL